MVTLSLSVYMNMTLTLLQSNLMLGVRIVISYSILQV